MAIAIERSNITEQEWIVYLPHYAGRVLLVGGLYRSHPHYRSGAATWPVSHHSEIGLAAEYLAQAAA